MEKIKKILTFFRDLPKSIYVNFKVFNIKDALKLPIRVRYNVKIGKIYKGAIKIKCSLKYSIVRLGFGGSEFVSDTKSKLSFYNNGVIIFNGKCTLAEGVNIFVDKGKIEFGENIYANKNLTIQSENSIIIEDNSLIGWNVDIRDTDGHMILNNGEERPINGKIYIGKHVWIASNCNILKNSYITENSVIGCNSLICGLKVKDNNCLIVGSPATVKKNNIEWRE